MAPYGAGGAASTMPRAAGEAAVGLLAEEAAEAVAGDAVGLGRQARGEHREAARAEADRRLGDAGDAGADRGRRRPRRVGERRGGGQQGERGERPRRGGGSTCCPNVPGRAEVVPARAMSPAARARLRARSIHREGARHARHDRPDRHDQPRHDPLVRPGPLDRVLRRARSASRSAPTFRSATTTAGSRSTRRPAPPASRSRRRATADAVGVQTGISLTTGDIDATHAELRAAGVDVDAEVIALRRAGPADVLVPRPRRQHAAHRRGAVTAAAAGPGRAVAGPAAAQPATGSGRPWWATARS